MLNFNLPTLPSRLQDQTNLAQSQVATEGRPLGWTNHFQLNADETERLERSSNITSIIDVTRLTDRDAASQTVQTDETDLNLEGIMSNLSETEVITGKTRLTSASSIGIQAPKVQTCQVVAPDPADLTIDQSETKSTSSKTSRKTTGTELVVSIRDEISSQSTSVQEERSETDRRPKIFQFRPISYSNREKEDLNLNIDEEGEGEIDTLDSIEREQDQMEQDQRSEPEIDLAEVNLEMPEDLSEDGLTACIAITEEEIDSQRDRSSQSSSNSCSNSEPGEDARMSPLTVAKSSAPPKISRPLHVKKYDEVETKTFFRHSILPKITSLNDDTQKSNLKVTLRVFRGKFETLKKLKTCSTAVFSSNTISKSFQAYRT